MEQTQQFFFWHQQLLVKKTRDIENKEKAKKQTQQPSRSKHLNKGTANMRQLNTKPQENKQKL